MRALTPNTNKCLAYKVEWRTPHQLLQPAPSSPGSLKKRWAEVRDPLLLKNTTAWRIKHNSFSDTKEFVSLPDSWRAVVLSLLNLTTIENNEAEAGSGVKARRGRRGWVFSQGGCRNLKQNWRSRSACWIYCLFLPMQLGCTKRKIKIVSDVQ